jgi:hypothetical protein
MNLFFEYDQGVGQTKTDKGYITDPSNSETMHSSILLRKVKIGRAAVEVTWNITISSAVGSMFS